MQAPGLGHKAFAGRFGWNLRRGIRFALLLGALGFLSPILFGFAFTVGRWGLLGSDEFDRAYDLYWLPRHLAYPCVGTALVFSAAGWASLAPNGPHRFARTLVIVFAICVPSWFLEIIVVNSQATRTRKDATHDPSLVEPLLVFVLFLPAVATAAALSAIRASSMSFADRKGPPDPGLA